MMDHERGVEAAGKDRLMALSDMASSVFPHAATFSHESKTPSHYSSEAGRIKDENHDSNAGAKYHHRHHHHQPQSPVHTGTNDRDENDNSPRERQLKSSTEDQQEQQQRSGRQRSRCDSQEADADYTYTEESHAQEKRKPTTAEDEHDQDSFIRTRSKTRQSVAGNQEDDDNQQQHDMEGGQYSSSSPVARKRRRVPDRHYRERSNSFSDNDETGSPRRHQPQQQQQQGNRASSSDQHHHHHHRPGSDEEHHHAMEGEDGDEDDEMMDEEQAVHADKERDGSESVETTSSKNDDGSEPTASSAQDNPANVKVRSMFIDKLYSMVEDPSIQHLIAWAEQGDMFYVFNCIELASTVLPKFFKHNNWQSFVRQLNMYGFHKIYRYDREESTMNRKNPETQRWQFYHPEFQRDQPHLRNNIKRKSARSNNSSNATFSRVMYERDKGYFMHREPVPRVIPGGGSSSGGPLPGQPRHSASGMMPGVDASGRPLAPHHGQAVSPSGYSGMRQPAQDPAYRPMGSHYRHDLPHGAAVEHDERGSVDYGSGDPRYTHGRLHRPSLESASPYMGHHRDERGGPPPSHRPYPPQSYHPHQGQPPAPPHGYPHHPSPYSPPHSSPRHRHERQHSTVHPMQRPPSPVSLTEHPLDHKHHPHGSTGAPGHSPDLHPAQSYPPTHPDARTQATHHHRHPGAPLHHRTSTGYHLQQHEAAYLGSGGHFRSQSAPGADPRADGGISYPASGGVPQQPSPKMPLTPSQGPYPTSYRPHSPPTTGPSSTASSEQSAQGHHRSSTSHGPVHPISPPMPPEEVARYREAGAQPALHSGAVQGNPSAPGHQGDERAKTSPSTAAAQLVPPIGAVPATEQQLQVYQAVSRQPGQAPGPQQQQQQQQQTQQQAQATQPSQPQRHPSYSSGSSSSLQPALPITSPPTPAMGEPQLLEWIPQYVKQLEKKMTYMEESYASLRQLALELQDVQKAQYQTIEWMRDRLERFSPEDMHSPSHVPAKRKADHSTLNDTNAASAHHQAAAAARFGHGHNHTGSYSEPAYSRSNGNSMYTHQHRESYRIGGQPGSGAEDTSGPYDPAAYPTSAPGAAGPGAAATAAVAYGQQQHPHQGQQQPSGAPSGAPQQATSPHQGHHPSHHPQQPHPMSTAHGAAGQESTDYGSAHLRERHHAPHHVNHHPHHAHHHRQASSMVHHSSAPSPPRGIATAAYGTQPQLQQ